METACDPVSYLAQEVVSVFAPHLHVGGDVDSERLQRPQSAGVRRHQERRALPIGQQAAHQVCQGDGERTEVCVGESLNRTCQSLIGVLLQFYF